MAEELTRALLTRAERGETRGAGAVLAEAQLRLDAEGDRRPVWHSGPAIAVATAAAVLVIVGGVLLAARLLVDEATPPESPTVPVTTTVPLTTGPVTPTTSEPLPQVEVGGADRVLDVAVAPDGSLWAATEAGVVRWDLTTESPIVFSEADGLAGRSVHRVAVAGDGTVWAAGDGRLARDEWLAHYDGTWTLLEGDVHGDVLGDLAVGPDGAVWVAAGADALIRIDADGSRTYRLPAAWREAEPWTFSLAVDPAGTVWATGTHTSGVFAFDGDWHHFGVAEGLASDVWGNIAVAPDGSVWMGGEGLYGESAGDIPAAGILRYRNETWTSFTTAHGLLSNDGDVAIGPGGDIWVVHMSLPAEVADRLDVHLPSGLSRYDGSEWVTYADVPAGWGGRSAASADGTLWMPSQEGIVGFDGVVSRLLIAGPEAVLPLDPPGPSAVFDMRADSFCQWFTALQMNDLLATAQQRAGTAYTFEAFTDDGCNVLSWPTEGWGSRASGELSALVYFDLVTDDAEVNPDDFVGHRLLNAEVSYQIRTNQFMWQEGLDGYLRVDGHDDEILYFGFGVDDHDGTRGEYNELGLAIVDELLQLMNWIAAGE
ncbi:MAG: hypothetical protein QNJ89_08975 [Acidimicrobiia bacterium]|nr:hypothetical protein [Acidimicrobiia bacterium]